MFEKLLGLLLLVAVPLAWGLSMDFIVQRIGWLRRRRRPGSE